MPTEISHSFFSLSLSFPSHYFSPRSRPPTTTNHRRIPSLKPPLKPRFPTLLRAATQDGPGRAPELELLGKPSPIPIPSNNEEEAPKAPQTDDALAPFLKFFKDKVSEEEDSQFRTARQALEEAEEKDEERGERVGVEYYEPKPGDLVLGVVVSGNENKLDVNVGADMLGTMLTKEMLPLYDEELPYLLCDVEEDKGGFMVPGKMGIVKDEEALGGKGLPGRPVVEVGTVVSAEVLGRTLSGRPLLSSRRMFRRVAWHRVRQVLSSLSHH